MGGGPYGIDFLSGTGRKLNDYPPPLVGPYGQQGEAALRRAPCHGAFGSEGRTVAGAEEGAVGREVQGAPAVRSDAGEGEEPPAPADQEESLVAEAVVHPVLSRNASSRTGIDGSFSGGRRRLPVAGAGRPPWRSPPAGRHPGSRIAVGSLSSITPRQRVVDGCGNFQYSKTRLVTSPQSNSSRARWSTGKT